MLVFAPRLVDDDVRRATPATDCSSATRLTLRPADEVADGDPLDIEFTDVDGTTGTSATSSTARPLVVNFFALVVPAVHRPRCPTSKRCPRSSAARSGFFGLAVTDRPEDASRIVDQTGITYPWSRDIRGDIAGAAGITSMPTTMFISRRRRDRRHPRRRPRRRRLRALIAEHLGVEPVIDAPLALAFASGMVAAVNPCGFAMLPAYVSFFLGKEGDRVPGRRASRSSGPSPSPSRSASASSSSSASSASRCDRSRPRSRSTRRGPPSSSASASPSSVSPCCSASS